MPSQYRTFLSQLREKRVAVLFGAGVSVNSGLPSGSSLRSALFKAITADRGARSALERSRLPLEAVLEKIGERFDISPVLELFNLGEPSSWHQLLGSLASTGIVSDFFTTNFDCLFERAAIELGCTPIAMLPGRFSPVGKAPRLVKLHGSASDEASVRTTLKDIALRRHRPGIARVLDYLFSSGPHSAVLVVGYSFSDRFDINSAVTRLPRPLKSIYYVQHVRKPNRGLHVGPLPHPVEPRGGASFGVNGDWFADRLMRDVFPAINQVPRSSFPPIWELPVKAWTSQVRSHGDADVAFMTGELVGLIPEGKLAREFYESARGCAESPELLADCSFKIAHSMINEGRHREALIEARIGVKLARRALAAVSRGTVRARALRRLLADGYYRMATALLWSRGVGRESVYAQIKTLLSRSLQTFRGLDDPSGIIGCQILSGTVELHRSRVVGSPARRGVCLRLAVAHYLSAYKAADASGDLSGQAISSNEIGNVRRTEGRVAAAMSAHLSTLEIEEGRGYIRGVLSALLNLAEDFDGRSKYASLAFREMALRLQVCIGEQRTMKANVEEIARLEALLLINPG